MNTGVRTDRATQGILGLDVLPSTQSIGVSVLSEGFCRQPRKYRDRMMAVQSPVGGLFVARQKIPSTCQLVCSHVRSRLAPTKRHHYLRKSSSHASAAPCASSAYEWPLAQSVSAMGHRAQMDRSL